MTPPLTMAQAAAAVGLSYDRFRKVWPQMVRELAFPSPFRARTWDPEAVAGWKARPVVASAMPLTLAANDGGAVRIRRAREALRLLRAAS